jgi:nitrile hydratase accessory protein
VKIDPAIAQMSGPEAPPRRNGELVFEAPWQGRAFGMALAVVQHLGLDWSEFQRRLIAAIAAAPESPYYEAWMAALETLVVDRGIVSRKEMDSRDAPPCKGTGTADEQG